MGKFLGVRNDEELERLVLAHSSRRRSLLETARQQILAGEGIPHEDFWNALEEEKPKPRKRRLKPMSKIA